MPKFPKGFARRKSTANQLENAIESPVAEHSFKVFERPDTGGRSFDGGVKLMKDLRGTGTALGPSHLDNDNLFENLGSIRGSGASNTNTVLTTDNSSRLSAASTAPSSTGSPGYHDTRSPHDKPFSDIPLPPIPRSGPGFIKNAGRAMSWGRHKSPTPPVQPPSPSIGDPRAARGSRSLTASSYASTATALPPKLEEQKDLGLSLGGDFSDMFSGFGNRKSVVMESSSDRLLSRSPDTLLSDSSTNHYLSGRQTQPTPLNIDRNSQAEEPPHSWNTQHSRDALISVATPPPVPVHGFSKNNDPGSTLSSRPQRSGGPLDNGLRRSSARRTSTIDHVEANDEDARLLRDSAVAYRRQNDINNSPKVRDSWALPSDSSYRLDDSIISSWQTGSLETTPKAAKSSSRTEEDSLFDSNIIASADIAQRFEERASLPLMNDAPKNRVMTPAQFERYRQDQERLRSFGGQPKDEEEQEETNYDDEDDEAERNKELAKQRRKQEAHMTVYRQQMMKVTGEVPPIFDRPSFSATRSSPNLGKSEDTEEEDEEVPLAILQAHGFPNKNKPPMRATGSSPNLPSSSMSNAGGASIGSLPVFARKLPEDPYYGAGLVKPSHRESLAFGGGAPSVTGGAPRGLPPGGLVGVIATEERSRAMRRGSPNVQGEYGPPSNGFAAMQPQARNSSGGSIYNGMGPAGPMPLIMTPGDQAQIQMSQQMEQFMAMQMQFMQMMSSGNMPPQSLPQAQNNGQMPYQSMQNLRPASVHTLQPRPMSAHQRAMTMLEPNVAPWKQRASTYSPSVLGTGYAPSMAPSERSNVGLPGRYRPVSQAHFGGLDAKSMSGGLGGWDNKTTVRAVVSSPVVVEEDEEEGWAEMAKKKEKKKSIWKTKKSSKDGLQEMLNYTH